MTKEQLFESMQYIGDDLISGSETERTVRRPWIGAAAAAACLILIAGVWFSRTQPVAGPVTGSGDIPKLKGDQTPPPDAISAGVPGDIIGAVNGPVTQPDAAPSVLAWKELESDAPASDQALGWFNVVGQPLTEEQLAMCGPEIRMEWMSSLKGIALFAAGELWRVNLTATDPAWSGEVEVSIHDRDAVDPPADAQWRDETETPASLNGQEYRAYRLEYDYQPGDARVWMQVVFEKENLEYTLTADAPKAQETQAAVDLMDLLLAYAGTHQVPDLTSIRYGDHVLIDETLTLAEALADPEFGAYFLREAPAGFETDIRRYRLDDASENYLLGSYTRNGDILNWTVEYASESDRERVTTAVDREDYDMSLYAVPWSESMPAEKRETILDPVFPVGELTADVIRARGYAKQDAGDSGKQYIRSFSVLFDDGVIVRVRQAQGISPDWLFEQIMALAEN